MMTTLDSSTSDHDRLSSSREEEYTKTVTAGEAPTFAKGEAPTITPRPFKGLETTRPIGPNKTMKTGENAANFFRTEKPCTFCGRKHKHACKLMDHP